MGLQPQYKNKITEYSDNTDKQLVYVESSYLGFKYETFKKRLYSIEITLS